MDAFSYLSVLVSVIIGLAVTQVLQGYRGILLARARVRLYWPSLAWSATILVMAAQSWWASFGLADYQGWTFVSFGALLLQTALLYMMAALVLPDFGDDPADLRDHYYREISPFFAIGIAMLVTSIGKDWLLEGELPEPLNLGFHALFATLWASALIVRQRWWHETLAVLATTSMGFYIAVLFARL